MQKSINSVKIRYNRFRGNLRFETNKIKNFNFEKGLVSVDSPLLFFINKAKSEDEIAYNTIVEMYLRYLEEDYTFIDEFVMDEVYFDYRAERLLKILKLAQKIKYNKKDLKHIFKLNNKDNPELHFFVKKSRDNFTLLLIDLYHLGIYGERKINKKISPISLKSIYKSKKNNTCELEKILELSQI